MKKIFYLLFLSIVGFSIISCSNDDDDEVPYGYNPVFGEWELETDANLRMVFGKNEIRKREKKEGEDLYTYNLLAHKFQCSYTEIKLFIQENSGEHDDDDDCDHDHEWVEPKLVLAGIWEYKIENEGKTLLLREAGSGENWDRYKKYISGE